MARRLQSLDITNTPELLHLAEEVQRTRQPRVLERGGQAVAVVVPITAKNRIARREQVIETEIWADAGVIDAADVWASYDPGQVEAGLKAAQGALASSQPEELIREIYEAREQDASTRPE